MKNQKKFTKKYIQSVLRTEDPTQIYRLVHQVKGTVTKRVVYEFIDDFAPTQKIACLAYELTYGQNKHQAERQLRGAAAINHLLYYEANIKHCVLEAFRYEIKQGLDNYTKRPMIEGEHLWFCSPYYGYNDYNKRKMMRVKGNERFCDLLVKVADKYFPMDLVTE